MLFAMKHNALLLGTLVLSSAVFASCMEAPTVTPAAETKVESNLNSNTVAAKPASASGASITLGKTSYKQGESIVATFTASADLDSSAWIGIVPADTAHGTEELNDSVDVDYMYLYKTTEGPVTLTAPTLPGIYDLRMNEMDGGGIELAASETFTVE